MGIMARSVGGLHKTPTVMGSDSTFDSQKAMGEKIMPLWEMAAHEYFYTMA
jgi:hypothetical protein